MGSNQKEWKHQDWLNYYADIKDAIQKVNYDEWADKYFIDRKDLPKFLGEISIPNLLNKYLPSQSEFNWILILKNRFEELTKQRVQVNGKLNSITLNAAKDDCDISVNPNKPNFEKKGNKLESRKNEIENEKIEIASILKFFNKSFIDAFEKAQEKYVVPEVKLTYKNDNVLENATILFNEYGYDYICKRVREAIPELDIDSNKDFEKETKEIYSRIYDSWLNQITNSFEENYSSDKENNLEVTIPETPEQIKGIIDEMLPLVDSRFIKKNSNDNQNKSEENTNTKKEKLGYGELISIVKEVKNFAANEGIKKYKTLSKKEEKKIIKFVTSEYPNKEINKQSLFSKLRQEGYANPREE